MRLTGIASALLIFVLCLPVFAGTLSVTVKDPSGALVLNATVTVTPQQGGASQNPQPVVAVQEKNTDLLGHVAFDELPSGQYHISVMRPGFEEADRDATIGTRALDLTFSLKISVNITTMQVSGKRSPLANSDPNYQALRKGRLTQVYQVSNLTIARDVGTFNFRSGSFSFLPPVLGHVTVGVFVGDGNFQLEPAYHLATQHLHKSIGADVLDEDFTAMVVYFSDSTFDEIKQNSQLADASTQQEEDALKRVKDLLETRRDPSAQLRPLTMLESMLAYEDIPNYEAEVLEELYNGEKPGSFRAFIRGKKYPDLRFFLNPHGAMPTLPAAEEVALINFEPSSFNDGIWYLSHYATELRSGHASSTEEKRLIVPEHYKLDALIRRANALGNIPDLAVTCDLRFRAVQNGVRMVKFDMVPDLQMARVTFNGNDVPFVQESRAHDGSFYLQMPQPLVKGQTYNVGFEYSGGNILQGRSPVPARRIWYPTPAGAASRATYDMTFRVPHMDHVIAVGELATVSREGGYDVSEWVSNQPIAQAVFRYSRDEDAPVKSEVEQTTNTSMTAMVATAGRGMHPPSLNNILTATGNSLRVFNEWFGKPGNPTITVCVGCGFDSAPGVVSVPPAAIVGFSDVYSQLW